MEPVMKNCDNCGKEIAIVHKDRLNRKHLFCCKKCEGEFRRKQTLENNYRVCPVCGKHFHVKPSYEKKAKQDLCCSRQCIGVYRSIIYLGENNPNFGNKGKNNPIWKSDRRISSYGYVLIRDESHPFKNVDGFVFEHRLVAEKYLLTDENSIEINGKRYLSPDYVVHHKDQNRTNNNVENLVVMTLSEHISYHQKLRKKLAS